MKPLHMVQTWWAEEARALAGPTLLSLGGFGQNDVPVDGLPRLAPRRRDRPLPGRRRSRSSPRSGRRRCTRQAGRRRPRSPRSSMTVRAVFPPVDAVRPLGPDGDALAAAFAQRVFTGRVAAADAVRG